MTSAAADLFERLCAPDAWSIVEAWVLDAEEETNHLEFKLKKTPTNHTIEPADIAEIAPALSAFANTNDGVIVVGVDAGGGDKKGAIPDRVRNIAPIANVDGFRGLVERRLHDWTMPTISGVATVTAKKPDGSGVLAIFVPQSDGGPHRVAGASKETNDRYYMRTSASTVPMPHSTLAAMFGRSPSPRLQLLVHVHMMGDPSFIAFQLRNVGRGAAREPAIEMDQPSQRVEWNDFSSDAGFTFRSDTTPDGLALFLFESPRSFTIYPGMTRTIGLVATRDIGAVRFRGTLHAHEMQPVRFDGALPARAFDGKRAHLGRKILILPTENG